MLVVPLYFEERFFRDYPPAINRPEFYYGFAGVTLAWQCMFLVIGSDPVRYRAAMLPAMPEKASFAAAIPIDATTKSVAAVVSPVTPPRECRMEPAPMKPMPGMICAAMRV